MERVELANQTLLLHPLRAVYWEEADTLLLADLHLGKAAHFRRAGIAVPLGVSSLNFQRLETLLEHFHPTRILLLGDLFHSTYNQVWPVFCDFLKQHHEVRFELVPGNHDILPARYYDEANLHRHPEILCEGPFCFSHHPLTEDEQPPETYNLCGHVHPCVRLSGNGPQRLRLPCFYFGKQQGILPAFGAFTGCGRLEVQRGDRVFVLTEDAVVPV